MNDKLIEALTYIAGRKCDCAKLGKEPPPCSHQVAKNALATYKAQAEAFMAQLSARRRKRR